MPILRAASRPRDKWRVALRARESHIGGVKDATQRRVLVAVLALGGAAIGFDRLVLGSGVSGPGVASAAASELQSVAQACQLESIQPVALTSEASVAARLDSLTPGVRDCDPATAFAKVWDLGIGRAQAQETTEDRIHAFAQELGLEFRGMSSGQGGRRVATVRYRDPSRDNATVSKALHEGDALFGAQIVAIDATGITLEYHEREFRVCVPTDRLAGDNEVRVR